MAFPSLTAFRPSVVAAMPVIERKASISRSSRSFSSIAKIVMLGVCPTCQGGEDPACKFIFVGHTPSMDKRLDLISFWQVPIIAELERRGEAWPGRGKGWKPMSEAAGFNETFFRDLVERGHIPKIDYFIRICRYLGLDPAGIVAAAPRDVHENVTAQEYAELTGRFFGLNADNRQRVLNVMRTQIEDYSGSNPVTPVASPQRNVVTIDRGIYNEPQSKKKKPVAKSKRRARLKA